MKELDLFQFFQGKWSFQRIINLEETINGEAKFVTNGKSLIYIEDGFRNGTRFTKKNTYVFYDEMFEIYNDEGLMHKLEFDLNTNSFPYKSSHIYYCKDDIYECLFELKNQTQFSISYKVTGPKKDYNMSTSYFKTQAE